MENRKQRRAAARKQNEVIHRTVCKFVSDIMGVKVEIPNSIREMLVQCERAVSYHHAKCQETEFGKNHSEHSIFNTLDLALGHRLKMATDNDDFVWGISYLRGSLAFAMPRTPVIDDETGKQVGWLSEADPESRTGGMKFHFC